MKLASNGRAHISRHGLASPHTALHRSGSFPWDYETNVYVNALITPTADPTAVPGNTVGTASRDIKGFYCPTRRNGIRPNTDSIMLLLNSGRDGRRNRLRRMRADATSCHAVQQLVSGSSTRKAPIGVCRPMARYSRLAASSPV